MQCKSDCNAATHVSNCVNFTKKRDVKIKRMIGLSFDSPISASTRLNHSFAHRRKQSDGYLSLPLFDRGKTEDIKAAPHPTNKTSSLISSFALVQHLFYPEPL